jgi:hypothetical protein
MRATSQAAEAISAAAGGWLYARGPRWPFWLQVPVSAVAFAIALRLADTPRIGSGVQGSHVRRALRIVGFAARHARLRAAMALSVVLGMSTFVMVWLIQPYMQGRGIRPEWFGPVWASAHVWLAAVSLASGRVVAALGVRMTLLGCCLLVPIGYAGLALSHAAWGAGFYLCFMTVRGLQAPILGSVMQQDAPADDRASVLSLAALLFRLAFVVGGPPIGALVDRIGMEPALGVLALALGATALAVFALFAREHRGGARRC